MTETKQNSLGTEPIGRLLLKFSVPTALTLMVNCLYNIVDQIFIGHAVGIKGVAATNAGRHGFRKRRKPFLHREEIE